MNRLNVRLSQGSWGGEALRRFSRSTAALLLCVVVAGYVALGIASSGSFVEGPSVRVFLQYLATPILIGLAQMVALCVGQLNLAVGALGGFTACLMGVLMADHGMPAGLAVIVGLLTATAIGLATGVAIVATQINGFIVTLATMTILLGAQYRLTGTRTVDGYSRTLRDFGTAAPLNIPWSSSPRSSRRRCWRRSCTARSRAGGSSLRAATRSRPGCPASPPTGRSSPRTRCRGC